MGAGINAGGENILKINNRGRLTIIWYSSVCERESTLTCFVLRIFKRSGTSSSETAHCHNLPARYYRSLSYNVKEEWHLKGLPKV